MIGYLVRRILLAIPTLFVMLTAIFVLVRLVPGDAASVILGDQASAASLAALREKLGLDQPVHVQYLAFLGKILTGRFRRVAVERAQRHPRGPARPALDDRIDRRRHRDRASFRLAARRRRRARPQWLGRLCLARRLAGRPVLPGLRLWHSDADRLRDPAELVPVLGNTSGAGSFAERMRALALPALNLGIIMTAYVMRVTRAAMLGVLTEDYIRTARAKGVGPAQLVVTHALRNGLIPIITVVGLYFGTLIGNSVLTEIIFNRPGLGKLIIGALNARDYTLLQGLMIIFAICVIVVNTLTDLAYGLVDPRVKYS
jgi:ABC-type dipeptide/oligopeptide/nickel transport system permease component